MPGGSREPAVEKRTAGGRVAPRARRLCPTEFSKIPLGWDATALKLRVPPLDLTVPPLAGPSEPRRSAQRPPGPDPRPSPGLSRPPRFQHRPSRGRDCPRDRRYSPHEGGCCDPEGRDGPFGGRSADLGAGAPLGRAMTRIPRGVAKTSRALARTVIRAAPRPGAHSTNSEDPAGLDDPVPWYSCPSR